jgi:tRNA G18 (ribose-2'-O)-methylase SpoU
LYIVTKNREFPKLLKKAKEITKGIDYEKMKLIVTDTLPKNYTLVGFSKLARENESDLKHFFKEKATNNQQIAFVFGDDKFGLTQETRDKMDFMFHLTPETKKPLRACMAFSYVLGIYTADRL